MAAFIMVFGISGAILAMQSGFKALDVARCTTLASQLLQSEMENLRLKNWSDIVAHFDEGEDVVVPIADLIPAGVTTVLTSNFQLTRTVRNVTAPVARDADEMKEIELNVSWTTIDGRTLSRRFLTYYTNNGLYDYYYTLARP